MTFDVPGEVNSVAIKRRQSIVILFTQIAEIVASTYIFSCEGLLVVRSMVVDTTTIDEATPLISIPIRDIEIQSQHQPPSLPNQYHSTTTTATTTITTDDQNDDDDLLSVTPIMAMNDAMRKKSPHVSFLNDTNHHHHDNDDDEEEEDDDDDESDLPPSRAHSNAHYHHKSSSSPSSLLSRRPASISVRDKTEDSILSEIIAEVKETIAEVQVEILDVLHEDIITPIKPRYEGDHTTKLSAVALAVVVFYKVSGGPFGCEPTVQAAGPLLALLGFTIVPIFVSIPEALVTAELGSAYPEPSGGTYSLSLATSGTFGPQGLTRRI